MLELRLDRVVNPGGAQDTLMRFNNRPREFEWVPEGKLCKRLV